MNPSSTPSPRAGKGSRLVRTTWTARLVLLALAAVLALAACTGTPAASPASIPPQATASAVPTATGTLEATPAPTASFPLTLTDDENNQVVIAAEPAKIVTMTPSATEIVFALGAGDRVMGVSDVSDYPAEAAKLAADPQTTVAKFDGVDVEKIVGLNADLVIAGGGGFNPAKDLEKLRSLKLPVLVLDAQGANGVEGVLRDIKLVGQAIGKPAEADALATSLQTQLDTISAAAKPSGAAPKVFYETGYDPTTGTIYGVADNSFVAGMIKLAGGDAVLTGDPNVWSLPLEKLVAADPDVIVLGDAAYGSTPAEVAKRAGWAALSAVKNGALRPVSDTEITRPGPRLPIGLRNLILAINPTASLPPAP